VPTVPIAARPASTTAVLTMVIPLGTGSDVVTSLLPRRGTGPMNDSHRAIRFVHHHRSVRS
jgi:hypothetical protein